MNNHYRLRDLSTETVLGNGRGLRILHEESSSCSGCGGCSGCASAAVSDEEESSCSGCGASAAPEEERSCSSCGSSLPEEGEYWEEFRRRAEESSEGSSSREVATSSLAKAAEHYSGPVTERLVPNRMRSVGESAITARLVPERCKSVGDVATRLVGSERKPEEKEASSCSGCASASSEEEGRSCSSCGTQSSLPEGTSDLEEGDYWDTEDSSPLEDKLAFIEELTERDFGRFLSVTERLMPDKQKNVDKAAARLMRSGRNLETGTFRLKTATPAGPTPGSRPPLARCPPLERGAHLQVTSRSPVLGFADQTGSDRWARAYPSEVEPTSSSPPFPKPPLPLPCTDPPEPGGDGPPVVVCNEGLPKPTLDMKSRCCNVWWSIADYPNCIFHCKTPKAFGSWMSWPLACLDDPKKPYLPAQHCTELWINGKCSYHFPSVYAQWAGVDYYCCNVNVGKKEPPKYAPSQSQCQKCKKEFKCYCRDGKVEERPGWKPIYIQTNDVFLGKVSGPGQCDPKYFQKCSGCDKYQKKAVEAAFKKLQFNMLTLFNNIARLGQNLNNGKWKATAPVSFAINKHFNIIITTKAEYNSFVNKLQKVFFPILKAMAKGIPSYECLKDNECYKGKMLLFSKKFCCHDTHTHVDPLGAAMVPRTSYFWSGKSREPIVFCPKFFNLRFWPAVCSKSPTIDCLKRIQPEVIFHELWHIWLDHKYNPDSLCWGKDIYCYKNWQRLLYDNIYDITNVEYK